MEKQYLKSCKDDVNPSDHDIVIALQQENETLKQQLDKALELPKELEIQHKKTRELTSQVLEANQKIENLQNRLKMSQQKTSEFESRQIDSENRIKKMNEELFKAATEKSNLEDKIKDLEQKLQKPEKIPDKSGEEKQKFFTQFSAVCSQEISSYSQAVDAVKSLQDVARREAANGAKNRDSEKTIQHQAKKIRKLKEALSQLISDNESVRSNATAVASEAKTKIMQLGSKINEQKGKIEELNGLLKSREEEIAQERENVEHISNEKETERQKFEQIISKRDQRINELKERFTTPDVQNNDERNRLIEEISVKNHENEQLVDKINQQSAVINELENKVKISISQCQKLQTQKDRTKMKIKQEAEHVADLEKTIACMRLEQDSNFAKQNSNTIELESLRMQLQAAEADHTQQVSALECQRQEVEKLKKSLEMLEETLKEAKEENEKVCQQRENLEETVKKQTLQINQLEISSKESKEKEENATKKLKTITEKQNDPNCNPQLVKVVSQNLIPQFNEPLRSMLNSLLLSTAGSPLLKVNTVFRAIADAFASSAEPAKEKEEELEKATKEFNEKKKSFESTLLLTEAAIQGLSYVLRCVKANDEAINCDPSHDNDLLDFASKNLQKLEASLPQNALIDPQFVSMSFIVGGTIEDRRAALQEIATLGWDSRLTFDLLSLQILINSVQEKELQNLRTEFETLHADIGHLEEATGCTDAAVFVEYVNKLSDKIRHLKSTNKKLQGCIKGFESREDELKAQEDLIASYDDIQQQKIEMEQQIQQLENDIKALTSVVKQRDSKIRQLEENIAKNDAMTSEEMQRLQSEISEYEKEIDEKNAELRNLGIKLQQAKYDSELQIKTTKKKLEDSNVNTAAKLEKLQGMYQQLKEKKKTTERALVQRFNEQQKVQQEEISKLVQCQGELRAKLNETIQELRKQSDEKNALSTKLSESLSAAEEKNVAMSEEIANLSVAKKSLEVQIQSINDQAKREVQLITSQNSFKEIAAETKHQEEIAMMKTKYDAEKSNLLMQILEEFDVLNSIGDADINEETALEALHNVSEKYKKPVY